MLADLNYLCFVSFVLFPLFFHKIIGNKAYCYRTGNNPKFNNNARIRSIRLELKHFIMRRKLRFIHFGPTLWVKKIIVHCLVQKKIKTILEMSETKRPIYFVACSNV